MTETAQKSMGLIKQALVHAKTPQVRYFDEAELRSGAAAQIVVHGKDSAALRAGLIGYFKIATTKTFARAEKSLVQSQDGLACAAELSRFHDVLIDIIYDLTLAHFVRSEEPAILTPISVIGTGGYGRGLMAPGSDIDLLFVVPERNGDGANGTIEFILYMLWDLGFKVGHATRSVGQCVQQARTDHTIRTAMLDARLILGDQDLFSKFQTRFHKEIGKKSSRDFIEAKLSERDRRHERSGQSRYLVEPNVKDGKGGLRDLHTLHWLVKYIHPDLDVSEWVHADIFSEAECMTFVTCEDFLWAVRCNLHFLAGKAEERLSFDMQTMMAKRMGYLADDNLSAVERFMKHYFGVAKAVGDLTRIVCSVLEYNELRDAPKLHKFLHGLHWPAARPKISSDDFVVQGGRLNVALSDTFETDPVNLIRLFAIAEQNDLMLHPGAVRLAQSSVTLLDDTHRADPEANRIFLDLLTSPINAEGSLRRMNEVGVLGQFIPDFGRIVSLMQFNMYHHFTVDEHLIQCIGILSDIENEQLGEEHPVSTGIMKTIENRRVLYVALLLHDIAKGRKEDHSIAGAKVALEVCPRLGLSLSETHTVAWLVEQHLVMSHFAQTRDVHDPNTARDFAQIVQSPERLKLLLVLTVADIRAVGPGVWTGWKGQLLRDLYYETMPLLTGGYTKLDTRARVDRAQQVLKERLVDWSKEAFLSHINDLYPPYWLKTDAERQAVHAKLMRRARQEKSSFVYELQSDKFTEMTEISLFTPAHARLLERIAGACAVAGANILGAQITTTRSGMALDTVILQRDFPDLEDEMRRAKRIATTVQNLVKGEVRLKELFAARARSVSEITAFTVEPQIVIDNTLSQSQTVIEVNGLDRMGLLYDLMRAFVDLKLLTKSAHITTFGEKAVDVFYVTDVTGMKIDDAKRHDIIRKTLYPILKSGEARVDDGADEAPSGDSLAV